MSSQIKHTPKQIFELMLTQQLWAFDDEDFERMWLVFINTFSELLQQKRKEIEQGMGTPDVKAWFYQCINELLEELK